MADAATTAAAVLTLAGSTWIIDTGGRLPADQSPSIAFNGNGAVAGFAGCNTYTGSFTQNGTEIVITNIAPTSKTCSDMVMIRETSYLEALQDTEIVEIDGGKLALKRKSGLVMQTFVKAPGK